jgi:hypothetical protein
MAETENKTRIFKRDGITTAITPGAPAVITTDAIRGASNRVYTSAASTTAATKKPDDAVKTKELKDPDIAAKEWIEWGDDDSFPSNLMRDLGYLGVGKAALESNADMHYGLGVDWFRKEITEEGKIKHIPVLIDDWVRLCREENMELVQSELVDSLEYFYMAFVQVMFNSDKSRINWVKVLNTPYCRFQVQDEKGNIPGIIYSAKFPETPSKDDIQKIPLFDKRDPLKNGTFVLPLMYGTWGKLFYSEPDYYSVFRNGWVKIATTVPAIINAMYTNFAILKYHIKIPASYFLQKYKDWETKSEDEQIKIFEYEQGEINKFLTGTENAGKAFISIYGIDDSGKEQPGWVIEPIKNYLEATAELPNNNAANYEILYAMNQDPTMQGMDTGGSNLSGSGSNKRQSRDNKMANMQRARLVSLQLPKLIAMLNGYYQVPEVGPYLYPAYISTDTSETLDENPTGKKTVGG